MGLENGLLVALVPVSAIRQYLLELPLLLTTVMETPGASDVVKPLLMVTPLFWQ